MEIEGVEQQIFLQPEMAIVGAVYSVNGYTGHVVLTTSDLENTSDYQTSTDVAALISAHNTSEEAHPYIQALISSKQDPIVAGNGISITGGNTIAIDTTVVATQQNLATEVTNRENADIALQGQIDAISASSDVVDIVGTYAELQNYDTSSLKDNDIIKVLQDSTQGNATTYYRWSTTTQSFTLIGQEGPYYTKAAADAQFVPQTRTINSKPLSANITLTASDVSALGQSDIVQTTGTSTNKVMSQNAVTAALATKLDSSSVPDGFFDGEATVSTAGTSLEIENAIKVKSVELQGDTQQQTYTGKNLLAIPDGYTGTSGGVTTTWSNNIATSNATSTTSTTCTLTSTLAFKSTTLLAGTYTFSVQSSTSQYYPILRLRDTSDTWHNYTITAGENSVTITTDYSANAAQLSLGLWTTGTAITNFVTEYPMLEVGSAATSYEPYTGEVPSPNPDYPQTVNVVTGTQTITISDGTLSENFTVDLGSTELCKIGTYQDYIYKSGSDWYVHKETGKSIVTGDSSEAWITQASNYGYMYRLALQGVASNPSSEMSNLVSDYFTATRVGGIYGVTSGGYIAQLTTAGYIRFNIGDTTDKLADFKTWLSTHNTTVYYALATPTDTKITDATLIGQLEEFASATLYRPKSNLIVSGNLPAILGLTAYNSNLNGIIEVLASTASTLGNINSALNIINNGGN